MEKQVFKTCTCKLRDKKEKELVQKINKSYFVLLWSVRWWMKNTLIALTAWSTPVPRCLYCRDLPFSFRNPSGSGTVISLYKTFPSGTSLVQISSSKNASMQPHWAVWHQGLKPKSSKILQRYYVLIVYVTVNKPQIKTIWKIAIFFFLTYLNHMHYKHHLFKQNRKTYISGFFPLAPKYHQFRAASSHCLSHRWVRNPLPGFPLWPISRNLLGVGGRQWEERRQGSLRYLSAGVIKSNPQKTNNKRFLSY